MTYEVEITYEVYPAAKHEVRVIDEDYTSTQKKFALRVPGTLPAVPLAAHKLQ
jgi:hypothetical protein